MLYFLLLYWILEESMFLKERLPWAEEVETLYMAWKIRRFNRIKESVADNAARRNADFEGMEKIIVGLAKKS